jgi:Gram-negative bacterial TonB protein C-terminal
MRFSTSLIVAGFLLAIGLPSGHAQQIPLSELADQAVNQSKLTLPGSAPFHLKAKIAEKDSPDSDFKADVDIMWLSPEKWRRSIQSPEFSQTVVVNNDKISEQDTGDYFPFWLHELVTALVDPLPMLESLKRSNSQIAKPNATIGLTPCARFESKVGLPPAQNSVFYVFCFEGSGLLEDVTTPQCSVEFKNYKSFKSKRVARLLVTDPEPGVTIEANVTELGELVNVDESQFTISQPTPKELQLKSMSISEGDLKSLSLQNLDIVWPPIRLGKTSGVLSMYVSVDRSGHVRETFPLNSDNSDLNDPVRRQVEKWQFKPAISGGTPVQVESILTFAFSTTIGDAVTILSDADARQLASYTVEPQIMPGTAAIGTLFTVRVLVSADGKSITVVNPNNLPSALFLASYGALQKWQFKPYIKDGKPDLFWADITFQVH